MLTILLCYTIYGGGELGMGEVFTSGAKSAFVVTRLDEVRKIIAIFTQNPLNSTKLLNFLAFAKAFNLYTTRSKESGPPWRVDS